MIENTAGGYCSHGIPWDKSCFLCGRYLSETTSIPAPATYYYYIADVDLKQTLLEIRDALRKLIEWAETTKNTG